MNLKRFAAALLITLSGAAEVAADARIATAGTGTTAVPVVNWSAGITYDYDGSGNIRRIGDDRFAYDHVGRLVEAQINDITREYTYDAFGNRTGCTNQPGMSEAGDCQMGLGIDPQTNRIEGINYDQSGNVERLFGHTYSWDAVNMQTRDSRGSGLTREYLYTANDERLASYSVDDRWNWTVRDLEGNVLREFTSLDRAAAETQSWAWKRDNVYRDGSLLASRHIAEATAVTYHYHLDQLGTPRRVSDQNSILVGFHDYLSFGTEVAGGLSEPTPGTLRYGGHERDSSFGVDTYDTLDYMHARFYSPVLARFLSVDPSEDDLQLTSPQTWNRYAYVQNSPINKVDPNGRGAFLVTAGAGALENAAFQVFINWKSGRPWSEGVVDQMAIGAAVGVTGYGLAVLAQRGVKAYRLAKVAALMDDARFAQTSFSNAFDEGGRLAGMTVDDVVNALNKGRMSADDVPVDIIVRDGRALILNTRSAKSLEAAGIPRSQWRVTDRTGQKQFEERLSAQLKRNKLTNEGTKEVRRQKPKPAGACVSGRACE